VAGGGGLHQSLEIVEQLRILPDRRLATASGSAYASFIEPIPAPDFIEAARDCGPRETGGSSDGPNPAMTHGEGLRGSPESTGALGELGGKCFVLDTKSPRVHTYVRPRSRLK
jgi:hypothetical protein